MKQCPFCAEDIQDAAIKCRYCGSMLAQPTGAATPPTTTSASGLEPPYEFEGVRVLAQQGKKIEAIKLLREKTGWDLRRAKDFVESPAGGAPPPIIQPAAPASVPPAQNKSVSKRRGFALLAVAVGFFMTLSTTTLGLGILLLWLGFAFALSGGAIVRWGGGFLAAMLFGSFGMMMAIVSSEPSLTQGYNSSSPTTEPATATPPPAKPMPPPSKPTPPPEPTYQLALTASKGYESSSGGYHIIEGTVKNLSDRPLKNVAAVGIWLDKNGEFITSDDALIDYNPILPGQTSPFKTMSRGNPAMQKYRVEFKTLFGGTLNVDDQRKK